MASDRRLHLLSSLFTVGSRAWQLLIPGLLVVLFSGAGSYQVWVMALFLPYAIYSVVSYLSYRYRLADDELVIRTGFFFKNERHIPYARIQNIDAVRNPLHLLLGVAEVRVETAGGSEPEARLQVLSVGALEEMRRRALPGRERSGAEAGVEPGAEGMPPAARPDAVTDRAAAPAGSPEPPRTILRLSAADVALFGLINGRGMVIAGAAAGAAWELGLLDVLQERLFGGEIFSGRGFVRRLVQGLGGGWLDALGAGLLLLAGIATLLLLLRVLSVGWALVKLGGFRLTVAGEDLRAEYGLFTQVAATIPLRRIQFLQVLESPLHRLFGRVAVRAVTAGSQSEQEKHVHRQWLAPLIGGDDLLGLLRSVEPEAGAPSLDWRPVDPRALRRLLKTNVLAAVLLTIPFVSVLGWSGLAVLAVLLPVGLLDARRQVRHMAYALSPAAVHFRRGWLWRRWDIVRLGKIQVVELSESPFDRRYRMASVLVDTAGSGASGPAIRIPYLDAAAARGMFDHLAARAAAGGAPAGWCSRIPAQGS